jgi:predicted short-subunit dehydrogenase-like oxidoreductase (DUF2520 family)
LRSSKGKHILKKTLNIIGAGRVGRVFAQLFATNEIFLVQDVLNRSAESSADAIAFIGAGTVANRYQDLRAADVTMLAVPDDQIALCCAELAEYGQIAADSVLFHCSGALSSTDLQAASSLGAAVASAHPVRSFADTAAVARHFNGTFCGLEGDPRAVALLEPALSAIGARVIALQASSKTLYHAASVFACNYLVTLMDVALNAYVAAGIPEHIARQMAEPLASETLSNVFRLGPAQALTGPIARGDLEAVVRQQLAVDAWDSSAGRLYKTLAEATKELAQRKNS